MKKHISLYLPTWAALISLLAFCWGLAEALLPVDPSSQNHNAVSRRDLVIWPVGIGGAAIYGKLVSDAVQKLSRGQLVYPEAHEQRVASTIATAMLTSIPSSQTTTKLDRPLRVLEVGIGKECRVIRRNLYRQAYADVAASGRVSQIDLTGVDITSPSDGTIDACRENFRKLDNDFQVSTNFHFVEGSISKPLDLSDGYFDCVICSLTLCSVDDQLSSLKEMRRILRSDGGCFGYVEHTAVLSDEPYRFLELQQTVFDPLQQAVADNCHLHRYTDAAIADVFGDCDSRTVSSERFLVEGMWPVSCQSCGVIQRIQG